jgi:hypothetical protein
MSAAIKFKPLQIEDSPPHRDCVLDITEAKTHDVGKEKVNKVTVQLSSSTMKPLKFKEKEEKKKIDLRIGGLVLTLSLFAVGTILYYTDSEKGSFLMQIAAVDLAEKTLKRMAKKTSPLISLISLGATVGGGYFAGYLSGRAIMGWAGVKMAMSAGSAAIVNRIIYGKNKTGYESLSDELVKELHEGPLQWVKDQKEVRKVVEEEILTAIEEQISTVRKSVVESLKGIEISAAETEKILEEAVNSVLEKNPVCLDQKTIKENCIHKLCGMKINQIAKKSILKSQR